MKENSHNRPHLHLQPHFLLLTHFSEHYFLTLIPSLGTWGTDTVQLDLVSICPFSGTLHLCLVVSLKWGLARYHRGKIMRYQWPLVFCSPFGSGRGKEAAHVGDSENKPR